MQIFEVSLFFKLRTTIQQKTVKPIYLLSVWCQEAGGRKKSICKRWSKLRVWKEWSSYGCNTFTDLHLFCSEGHYMLVQSSSGVTKDRARLISPVFNSTGATCHMTFKYHMFGASAGELIQIRHFPCMERRKVYGYLVVSWSIGGWLWRGWGAMVCVMDL